ncbi:aconitase A [Pseudomonas oryzihabitans]
MRGLPRKPWVKTLLSPGSRVVADYLGEADLLSDFAALGFELAGFGCMTCIGNSGTFEPYVEAFADQGLKTVVVLSGNRNFEGRVNPNAQFGYLTSPALVVGYALAGSIDVDLEQAALGLDQTGQPVYLRDLMPNDDEVQTLVRATVRPELFRLRNATLWDGTHHWQALSAEGSVRFPWQGITQEPPASLAVRDARALMVLGDNSTTDHISPASAIPLDSPAGRWLVDHGEAPEDLNQYSTRRSNHEVMMRGAFVNRAVENRLLPAHPGQGGWREQPTARYCRCTTPPSARSAKARRWWCSLGSTMASAPVATGRPSPGHARRPARYGVELRAHPPQQPDRHGHLPGPLPGGPDRRSTGPERRRTS